VEKVSKLISLRSTFTAMQIKNRKKSQNRLVISTSLFALSILASFLFAFTANSGDGYWIPRHPIAKGVRISASDVELVKSDLSSRVTGYLPEAENPIGLITLHNLQSGEFLSRGDLGRNNQYLQTVSLSLAIKASDLPSSLSIGETVTLYQIQDSQGNEVAIPPKFLIADAFIKDVLRGSSNFSGEVSITISINREELPEILAAYSSGRIVVVSSRG